MKTKFKKGAASFYVVAFSTLILLIVVASFASLIIAQITRSSNDDLSQSAYDSALAGVEDARRAYYKYLDCKSKDKSGLNDESCPSIEAIVEGKEDCDMVKNLLYADQSGEIVEIKESNIAGNNMAQAYTCVEMKSKLSDYRSSLSPASQLKTIRPKFDGANASDIKGVRISWGSKTDGQVWADNGITNDGRIEYKDSANPPVIFFGLVQTGDSFDLASFERTIGDRTNRGMLYLVPKTNWQSVGGGQYKKIENGLIGASELLKSNDKVKENLPYLIRCDGETSDFICSVEIDLPSPIGDQRNNDSFMVVVGMPYGNIKTDFALEFLCKDDSSCMVPEVYKVSDEPETTEKVYLDGVQVEIDSTGRANDLYRRVKVRLEEESDYPLSVMGPLELFGNNGTSDNNATLQKEMTVTSEYNFPQ